MSLEPGSRLLSRTTFGIELGGAGVLLRIIVGAIVANIIVATWAVHRFGKHSPVVYFLIYLFGPLAAVGANLSRWQGDDLGGSLLFGALVSGPFLAIGWRVRSGSG